VIRWRSARRRKAEEAAAARARLEASERRYRLLANELAELNLELDRRAAELERSNHDLEQFAYVASHDLSEPLRMVTSYLQLLERRYGDTLDDDGREFIRYAVDGGARMRMLIDDLLIYSRVGRAEPRREQVDLGEIVQATLRLLAPSIQESDARIEVTELPVLQGDPSLLALLLQNLIANAIKFAGDAAPEVTISAARSGNAWRITVADRGIGIEPQHADRVFKMFQRLHTRDEFQGTGIGLAVCRRIAEQHRGAIWLEANSGPGARFVFELPDRAP
jgi:chemotaxis family two-component system sensor kinase Cph1